MRLWSLSPKYLDVKGLLAVWREGLLAKAVLSGQTQGYLNHPQLDRFKAAPAPLEAINYFLEQVYLEAIQRNYHFSGEKIMFGLKPEKIPVTVGQVGFEYSHLYQKLLKRDPRRLAALPDQNRVELNLLFILVPGAIADWEKG